MQVSGTVTRASHRQSKAGNTYASVLIARPGTHDIRLRYLADFAPRVRQGQHVTIEGIPLMYGRGKPNVGAVSVTIHEESQS